MMPVQISSEVEFSRNIQTSHFGSKVAVNSVDLLKQNSNLKLDLSKMLFLKNKLTTTNV